MAVLTFNPTGKDFGTINYPSVSGQYFGITNAVGVSAEIRSISLNNSNFVLGTDAQTVTGVTLDVSDTTGFTISSNWTNNFLDNSELVTASLIVSGHGLTPSTSSVSVVLSAYFDGLDYPSNIPTVESPDEEHARLYVTSHI